MSGDGDGPAPALLVRGAAVAWRVLVLVVGLVVLGLAFVKLRLIILPAVVALFLSTVLVPPAAWLRRHGWSPLLATWTVLLGAVLLVAGIAAAVTPTASSEFHTVGKDINRAINSTENWLAKGPFHVSRAKLRQDVTKIRKQLSSNQATIFKGALSGATLLAEVVGGMLLTAVLTFFFVKDGPVMTSWFTNLFEGERREDVTEIGRRCWRVITGYVHGAAINGLINALVLSVGLLILGVPLVVPIAVLTFVSGFLPLAGGIISGVIAVAVALATQGWVAAVVVAGLTVLIHNLEGYVIGPKILGHAVRLHPVVIILVLSLGTVLGGIIGAFLAVPVVATLLSVNEYYRQKRRRARILPATGATALGSGPTSSLGEGSTPATP